jgi:hypothetical protein
MNRQLKKAVQFSKKARLSPLKLAAFILIPYLLLSGKHSPELQCQQTKSLYSQIVERVFKFTEGLPAELAGVRRRIVIRYLPSTGAESQVVVLEGEDGTVRMIEFRVRQGTNSISDATNRALVQNPEAGIQEVLKNIQIERIERPGHGSIKKLLAVLSSLSIPMGLGEGICVDGATYEIWVQTASNEIHATLSDCAFGEETSSTPIIQWIKLVRDETQQIKN